MDIGQAPFYAAEVPDLRLTWVRIGAGEEQRMVSARRRRIWFVFLWMSLATVLGHAVMPLGSPLAKSSGSAFSVSTSNVSLGPTRAAAAVKAKRQQRVPPGDGEATAAPWIAALPYPLYEASLPVIAAETHAGWALAQQTPPPAPTFSGVRARAPPRV
jgi:hypothetical protein